MRSRRAGSINGASMRKTKRHLGQSPHHPGPRRSGSLRKTELQLVKAASYPSRPANERAIASSDHGRRSENQSSPGARSARQARKRSSNASPLLHWWFTSSPFQARFGDDADRSLDIAMASNP